MNGPKSSYNTSLFWYLAIRCCPLLPHRLLLPHTLSSDNNFALSCRMLATFTKNLEPIRNLEPRSYYPSNDLELKNNRSDAIAPSEWGSRCVYPTGINPIVD